METAAVSFNIRADLVKKLRAASDRAIPYAPTQTAIVERGIELALIELEKSRKKK